MNSLDLTAVLAIPVGLALLFAFLAILTPLSGVLVRYRANFTPKRIRLTDESFDVDGAAVALNDNTTIGYFGMMKRVFRLEGFSGLYKGFMPNLLSIICLIALSAIFLASLKPGITTSISNFGPLHLAVFLLATLIVGIPLQILTNRAIVTPYRLSFFGVRSSLKALFTPYERRRPWVLYMTPGLVIAVVLQMIVQIGFVVVSQWFATSLFEADHERAYIITAMLGYCVLVLVVVTISVPLQVIATRLSVQRDFGGESPSFEMDLEDSPLQEYASEHVVQIRDKPYTGLIDCAHKLGRKEGWMTLYRAWWLTLLAQLSVR